VSITLEERPATIADLPTPTITTLTVINSGGIKGCPTPQACTHNSTTCCGTTPPSPMSHCGEHNNGCHLYCS
jgi:hypothetical protein